LLHFFGARVGDLCLHPVTRHAGVGENQQQLVVNLDRLIDLFVNLPALVDVMRRKPAANALGLQVGVTFSPTAQGSTTGTLT
jgi:hypothetical protein